MNSSDKVTLDLAEKICQRKFEQKFGSLKEMNVDKDTLEELLKDQIDLWKELGKTHLSTHAVACEPPIKQALYYLCKDKIKFCMNKLLQIEED
jgi:hypothetical protein